MATVFIPPQMRDLTGGCSQVEVEAGSFRKVVQQLDEAVPGLGVRIVDGDRLVSGLAVSVDGVVSSFGLLTKVGAESEGHIVAAIGGGV